MVMREFYRYWRELVVFVLMLSVFLLNLVLFDSF